jgi:hypothetical protein
LDRGRRFDLKEDKRAGMLYFELEDGEDEPQEESQVKSLIDNPDNEMSL